MWSVSSAPHYRSSDRLWHSVGFQGTRTPNVDSCSGDVMDYNARPLSLVRRVRLPMLLAAIVIAGTACSTDGVTEIDANGFTATSENYLPVFIFAGAVGILCGIGLGRIAVTRVLAAVASRRSGHLDLRETATTIGLCLVVAACFILPITAIVFASYQSEVVVDLSNDVVTQQRKYMVRPASATTYAFDDIYGIIYDYRPPHGEDKDRGTVKLVMVNGSDQSIYSSDPPSAIRLAEAISAATGLPIAEE